MHPNISSAIAAAKLTDLQLRARRAAQAAELEPTERHSNLYRLRQYFTHGHETDGEPLRRADRGTSGVRARAA